MEEAETSNKETGTELMFSLMQGLNLEIRRLSRVSNFLVRKTVLHTSLLPLEMYIKMCHLSKFESNLQNLLKKI